MSTTVAFKLNLQVGMLYLVISATFCISYTNVFEIFFVLETLSAVVTFSFMFIPFEAHAKEFKKTAISKYNTKRIYNCEYISFGFYCTLTFQTIKKNKCNACFPKMFLFLFNNRVEFSKSIKNKLPQMNFCI